MARIYQAFAVSLLITSLIALVSLASSAARPTHLVTGATQMVCGAPVKSWARVTASHKVVAVGVTIPVSIAQNPPDKPGKGPVGAVAVLPFPKVVQDTTYFNHFEMQWNPHGHPPACCFGLPHFDFHFYAIPVAEEWKFGPRDPKAPAADRIPVGYAYPGADQCIPNMGVHAVRPTDVTPGHPFIVNMVAGFYGGRMNFIEPMVTRTYLLKRQSFTLAVPMPPVLGRHTLYPTRFQAVYHPNARSYDLVFTDFREMAQ